MNIYEQFEIKDIYLFICPEFIVSEPTPEEVNEWAASCGQSQPLVINTSMNTGYIQSLNYPYKYFNYLDCTWAIPVEAGKYVNLTFIDFEVQNQ